MEEVPPVAKIGESTWLTERSRELIPDYRDERKDRLCQNYS